MVTGNTTISLRTLERIVAHAVEEVPGTTKVSAKLAGLGGHSYPRLLVQLDQTAGVAAVDAAIATVWPSPITAVAEAARAAVAEAIAAYTGYITTRVNVTVAATVAGERVTAAQLEARPIAQAAHPRARSPRASQVTHPVARTSSLQLADVVVPTPHPLRTVSTPAGGAASAPLRPVRTPVPAQVVVPTAPPARRPRRAAEPPQRPLRTVRVIPANSSPRRVFAPMPQPLRHIEVRPVEVRPVVVRSQVLPGGKHD